jgi:hypothetical protein
LLDELEAGGDDPEGATDGDQIFDQGDDKVGDADGFDGAGAGLIAGEGAYQRADDCYENAEDGSLAAAGGEARSGETAHEEAGDEAGRGGAAGSFRELVAGELEEREHGEDDGGGSGADPSEEARELEPAVVRGPGGGGDGSEGTQAGEYANEKNEEESHGRPPRSLFVFSIQLSVFRQRSKRI